jgi:hypothetical protein
MESGFFRAKDQDLVNGLIYSNATTAAGIVIKLYDSKDYFHCAWKNSNRENVIQQLGLYKLPSATRYPLLIHQADRSALLMKSVMNACPQEFPQIDPYLRKIESIKSIS